MNRTALAAAVLVVLLGCGGRPQAEGEASTTGSAATIPGANSSAEPATAPATPATPAEPETTPAKADTSPREDVRLVCGFDTPDDLDRMEFMGEHALVTDRTLVTQGQAALRISVTPTDEARGVEITGERLKGWEKFERMAVDVHNLSDEPFTIAVRFDDVRSTNYATRTTIDDRVMQPGANTLTLPIHDLKRQNEDPLDISTLRRLLFYVWQPKREFAFVLDNLRLEGAIAGEAAGRVGKGGKAMEPRRVTSFEDEAELKEMEFEGTEASLTMQPERVTDGKSALAVTFKSSSPWPGFRIVERARLAGWEKYDLLVMDVFNLSEQKLTLTFRFDDAQTDNYETRAHASKLLQPGKNTVAIPLKALVRENGRPLNVATLKALIPHISGPRQDVQLIFDNVRLQVESAAELDVANAHLFDFSGEGGIAFSPFRKVTPDDAYRRAKGWGFLSTKGLSGSGRDLPDDLAGDHVTGKDFTFRVDVPDGNYRVECIVRRPDGGYRIRVGEQVIATAAQGPERWSKDGLYRGIDDDYYPGKDLWKTPIDPDYPTHRADVTVTGARLELACENVQLASLVVYPADEEGRMAPVLADVLKRRKEQFEREHCTIELPKPNAAAPEPTADQRRAGLVLFSTHRTDVVYPSAVPTAESVCGKLTLAAARSQREPASFAVYPLKAAASFTVTASDLVHAKDARIPADRVDVRLARLAERLTGQGSCVPTPTQLVKRATPLYPGFTRQYWVTVEVPADAQAGLYRGELTLSADGKTSTLPVELTVYPFELPVHSRATFAFYCSSPFGAPDLEGSGRTFEQALEQEILDMKRHGLTSMQVPLPKMRGVRDDRIVLDWSELETTVKLLKAHDFGTRNPVMWYSLGFGRFLMRQVGDEFTPKFNEVLKNTVAEADRWWKDRGLEVLFWVVDEPREQAINPWNRNFKDTMAYLRLYREVPGVKTSVTPMGDESHGVDYTPMIPLQDVIQTHPWPRSARTIARARKDGTPVLWLYNAGTDRLSYGMYVWKLRALGRWQWHYQWPGTSWHPFRDVHQAVVYPSPDGPVPTLAYEHVAMGITDYRYIELLENLAAEADRKGVDVSAARKLLGEIDDGIPQWPSAGFGDGTQVGEAYRGDVNVKLDAWRAKLAAEIIRLGASGR